MARERRSTAAERVEVDAGRRRSVRGQPASPADQQGLAEEILRRAREHGAQHDEAEEYQFGVESVPVAPLQRVCKTRQPLAERGPGAWGVNRMSKVQKLNSGIGEPQLLATIWKSGSPLMLTV